MLTIYLLLGLLQGGTPESEVLNGRRVVEAAILYHDPEERWPTLQAELNLTFEDPEGGVSSTKVRIDNLRGHYAWIQEAGGVRVVTGIRGGECFAESASGEQLEPEFLETNKINCANTKKMRNYHLYLYGLPMKLRDPGTSIEDAVGREVLDGQSYLVVRVPYEKDVWDFFFHPETFALEAYRFYVDEQNSVGEIIQLEKIEQVQGIRLPKRRAWTNTHDGKFLGTDIIVSGRGIGDELGNTKAPH